MRAVVQRVARASVRVDGTVVGCIDRGVLVLLGVAAADAEEAAARLAGKIARLRIFERDGRFDVSLLDVAGAALVVSQFTLLADYKRQTATASPTFLPGWKGNRPSFTEAARPEQAEPLYQRFCEELRKLGVPVETGVFGTKMEVALVNDGPVTIIIDA